MKKIVFLFLFLLFSASLLAIEYQEHYSSSIALVVGINNNCTSLSWMWEHMAANHSRVCPVLDTGASKTFSSVPSFAR